MMTYGRSVIALVLAATVGACGGGGAGEGGNATENVAGTGNRTGSAGGGGSQAQTIAAAAASTPELSSFVRAVESAGLTETLGGAGPYTVFAPSNEAFAALGAGGERARLVGLLTGHIVPGTVTSQDLARAIERGEGGRAELATIAGDNLSISRDGEAIVISNGAGTQARIVAADQILSNGVVHRIDRVIAPAAAGTPPQPKQ